MLGTSYLSLQDSIEHNRMILEAQARHEHEQRYIFDTTNDYLLLRNFPDELKNQVNHLLTQGYTPLGGPTLDGNRLIQAMYREPNSNPFKD